LPLFTALQSPPRQEFRKAFIATVLRENNGNEYGVMNSADVKKLRQKDENRKHEARGGLADAG
jgi:hypothetical protein